MQNHLAWKVVVLMVAIANGGVALGVTKGASMGEGKAAALAFVLPGAVAKTTEQLQVQQLETLLTENGKQELTGDRGQDSRDGVALPVAAK